jgi:hypothetical protein
MMRRHTPGAEIRRGVNRLAIARAPRQARAQLRQKKGPGRVTMREA